MIIEWRLIGLLPGLGMLAALPALGLLGCESGPTGRSYGCYPSDVSGCICETGLPGDDGLEACAGECCYVQEFVREGATEYRCWCEGQVGAAFEPAANVCFEQAGAERVDACPPTRVLVDEPLGFACTDASEGMNVLVQGAAEACFGAGARPGCLLDVDGAGPATCQQIAEDDVCSGIAVTDCGDALASALTETIVEGWACRTATRGGVDCSCTAVSTAAEEGTYYPIWTHPCPPIFEQCCRYSEDLRSCSCRSGDECGLLGGVEVSACPVSDEELLARGLRR